MRLALDLDERLKSVETVDLSELLDAAKDAVKNANCGVAFQICEIIVKRMSQPNEPIVRKRGGKIAEIYRGQRGLSGGIKRASFLTKPVSEADKKKMDKYVEQKVVADAYLKELKGKYNPYKDKMDQWKENGERFSNETKARSAESPYYLRSDAENAEREKNKWMSSNQHLWSIDPTQRVTEKSVPVVAAKQDIPAKVINAASVAIPATQAINAGKVLPMVKGVAGGVGAGYATERYLPESAAKPAIVAGAGLLGGVVGAKVKTPSKKVFVDWMEVIKNYKAKHPSYEGSVQTSKQSFSSHIQGNSAIEMFRKYGGETIPEGSELGKQIKLYVPEARLKYGLWENKNISDNEIAEALYKHAKELGGNTAAVNKQGEPLLLFRGDTKHYTQLKNRNTPNEVADRGGTMDNALGTLFVGEFPNKPNGISRYVGTGRFENGNFVKEPSGTGAKTREKKMITKIVDDPFIKKREKFYVEDVDTEGRYILHKDDNGYPVFKLGADEMESGVNDINSFVVRTPKVRNATDEISVLSDATLEKHQKFKFYGKKDTKYRGKENAEDIEQRKNMAEHYNYLLRDAQKNGEGLLLSEKESPLRHEHKDFSYYALPNNNNQNAKHLLPYDLNVKRNWSDPNIFKAVAPVVGSAAWFEANRKK